jgi:hypothetical protein
MSSKVTSAGGSASGTPFMGSKHLSATATAHTKSSAAYQNLVSTAMGSPSMKQREVSATVGPDKQAKASNLPRSFYPADIIYRATISQQVGSGPDNHLTSAPLGDYLYTPQNLLTFAHWMDPETNENALRTMEVTRYNPNNSNDPYPTVILRADACVTLYLASSPYVLDREFIENARELLIAMQKKVSLARPRLDTPKHLHRASLTVFNPSNLTLFGPALSKGFREFLKGKKAEHENYNTKMPFEIPKILTVIKDQIVIDLIISYATIHSSLLTLDIDQPPSKQLMAFDTAAAPKAPSDKGCCTVM